MGITALAGLCWGTLGDMPKATRTKTVPTSLDSLFPQICPLLEHGKLVAWPHMLGLPNMVSVDNVAVNQACGVGVGSTQWGDWLPNGITETRVLLGREPLPHIVKLSRDSIFQSMIRTIMAAWDRGVMRQVTGCVTEKLGRMGFLTGLWAAAAGQPPLNNHIPLL